MSTPLPKDTPPANATERQSPTIRADVTATWQGHQVVRADVTAQTERVSTVADQTLASQTETQEPPLDGYDIELVPLAPPSENPNASVITPLAPSPANPQVLPPDAPVICSRPLSSGNSTAVNMSSEEASSRVDRAFLALKELVLPQASHCQFYLDRAAVRYAMNGIEQPGELDLRKLITESPNPTEAVRAAKELQKALSLATGEIIALNIDEPAFDTQRISLRQEGDIPSNDALSQLPALLTTEAIKTEDSSIKESYKENVGLVVSLALKAFIPEEEIIAGLNRIGHAESALSLVTSRLRNVYTSDKAEKEKLVTQESALRTRLTTEKNTAQQEKIREEIVKNISQQRECDKNLTRLDKLLQQTNVDRLALYMGLMFAPDTSKVTTSRESIKAADVQAARIQENLNGYLGEKKEQMKPSLKKRIWAKLPLTKPLDEIKIDPNYATNVGSLAYAHLPSIEAQRGSENWMVRNAKAPLAPSKEAAWISLMTSRDGAIPAQLASLFKELAEITCPGDKDKQGAFMNGFTAELQAKKSKAPLPRFTTDNISEELWTHYNRPSSKTGT